MEFNPLEQEVEEFNPVQGEAVSQEPLDPNKVREQGRLLEASIGVTQEEFEKKANMGLGSKYVGEAEMRLAEIQRQRRNKSLEEGIEKRLTLDELKAIYDNNPFTGSLAAPTEALLASGSMFSDMQQMAYRRSVMAAEIANKVMKEASTGTADLVGEVADVIIGDGIVNIFGGTGSRNEAAQSFNNILMSGKSDREVAAELETLFRGFADQGIFTGSSSIYLQSFLDQVYEAGVGQRALDDDILSAVSIGADVLLPVGGRAIKAGSAINTIAKLKSTSEATDMGVKAVLRRDPSANLVPNSSSSALTPGKRDLADHTGPGLDVAKEIEALNETAKFIANDIRFARVVDEDQLADITDTLRKNYRDGLSKGDQQRLRDFNVEYEDGYNNLVATAYIGTNKGGVFTKQTAAEKMAKKLGGEVEPHQMADGKTGWLVKIQHDVSQADKAKPSNLREVNGSFISKILSTTARTTKSLDAILKINEGQASRVFRKVQDTTNKAARAAGREEVRRVDFIVKRLNEDPALSLRRTPYSVNEFKVEYKNKYGVDPSDKTIDFYNEQLKLNDAEYILRADLLMKKAVENGEAMFRFNDRYFRGKIAKELDDSVKVWDETTQSFRPAGDLKQYDIVELFEDGYKINEQSVRFVRSGNTVKRRFSRGDLLGYNPGGSRIYQDVKFYVKQPRDIKLADGSTVTGTPKTFLATVTSKEAKLAVTQLNNIVDAIKAKIGKAGSVEKLIGNKEVEDAILANNDWNLGIEGLEDLMKFAKEWEIDLTKKFDFAPDGEQLIGSRSPVANTVGDNFFVSTNKNRGDKPLIGFGGSSLDTLDPSEAIERSFVISLNRFADWSYTTRAVSGFLKVGTDLGLIDNLADLKGLSNIEKMKAAKISTSLPEGKKLAAERDVILDKINYRTKDMQAWDNFVGSVSDYVYDKGGKKVARNFREARDPVTFLRSMAFNLKLGLFAIDQFMVQASQVVNIMGISKNGFRSTLITPAIRMALVAPDSGTVNSIARRISSVTGVNEEEFNNIIKFIRESGRDIVDNNIIQLDGNQTIYRSYMKRFLDAGRIPFNEGELMARISGVSSAYLDYIEEFGEAADAFSDVGRQWITRRQDILTASMTSKSSAAFQRSSLAVPTQFMTYSMRMMEQLFVPGLLSGKERLRLLGAQTVFWGGAGLVPYGFFQDKLAYEANIDLDPAVYNIVRYGAVDYLLSSLTEADTDLSSRVGAVGGLTTMLQNMYENSLVETVAGPSGAIFQDTASAGLTLASNMFSGKWDYITYDWNRLARNITSFNRAYNFWVANQQGEYLNRNTGEPLLQDLNQSDAFALGLGIPLKENNLAFTLYDYQTKETEHIKEHAKKMREMRRIMIDYIDAGDTESAKRVSDDIAAMYNILTPYNKREVMRAYEREEGDFFEGMVLREIDRNRSSTLTEVAKDLNNGE